ncbi:MAG: pleC 2 [Ferruginibacter sp.]|nr:pleC 2 [Ferruginibacter sp.]
MEIVKRLPLISREKWYSTCCLFYGCYLIHNYSVMNDAVENVRVPDQKLRNSGIDILGGLEWGTHCCNFYDTKQDLYDILIPYFKAGLENNEFCLWITSDAMTAAEAIHALQQVVPNLEDYIKKGSIEIIPHGKWYMKETIFDTEKLIKSWLEKLDKALALGYDGMRANGNESWVEHTLWKDFIDYERQLNYAIANHRIIVLCTYPLANCNAAGLLDIVHTHERAVSKRNDKWEVVEEPFLIQTKAQIQAENSHLEQLVAKRTFQLALTNEDLQKEIAGHKETEEILRKTEANYREIFDKASDAIFIIDVETGSVIDANEKSSKITGFSKAELINRHYLSLSPDCIENEVNEKIHLAATRGDQIFDCQFRYRDGNIHWVEVNLTFANIAGTERVLSFFHEIDTRKSAEAALQKSEENLHTIFDNTDTGYILLDINLRIISFNQVAFDFVSRELCHEIKTEEYLLNYFRGENLSLTQQSIKEVLNGAYVNYEVSSPQHNGSVKWYYRRMFPILNDKNIISGIVVATSDITERKKAEEEIRRSEEDYRYLFNNNPACIFIADPISLKVIEVNDTAIEQYGYSREEFLQMTTLELQKSILELRSEEGYSKYREFLEMAGADDTELKLFLKWTHRTKSGDIMFMNIASHRIMYKGRPVILSIATNITDKVLLEQKLDEERREKQLEITDAVITAEENERQEIGRELHDNVNQILASCLLYLGMAQNKELKEHHPFIDEVNKFIGIAINEIRNLSHSLISPFIEEYGLFEALDLLIETLSKSSLLTIQKEVTGLNESTIPEKLRLSIYRIVQEQMNNILKHANARNIHIKLIREKEQLLLTIKDDGVGFDPSEKANGIGLLNIRTRASLFNGKMNVVSSPGNGCELIINFPQ